MSRRRNDHHVACPGGCDQLSDECACPNPNPLGSMRIEPPVGSRPDPELVVTRETGHGLSHGTHPADIRMQPLTGPHSPGAQR